MYQNKSILILDEATASLDGIAEKFIIDQLRSLSQTKTIIMVTHEESVAKLSKRRIDIFDGKIARDE